MKKLNPLCKMALFFFAICCMLTMPKIPLQAAKKTASVTYVSQKRIFNVTYKNKIIASSFYKPEIVYAKTDITSVRKGPGKSFKKSKAIKKDMGEKLLKVGSVYNNKWSIVTQKGRYYFVASSKLSLTKPSIATKKIYKPSQLKHRGVIHWNGWRWTWYSQRRMPGHGLHIPGRHVDKNGYVCDKDGYICLASGRLRRGSVVKTPFGKKGKVYDSGCAKNTLDVYTNF